MRKPFDQCMIGALAAVLALGTLLPAAIVRPKSPTEQPAIACRLPIVTAPLMTQAPKIDGTVDAAEWTSASQLAPMVTLITGLATDDYAGVWVGYTADTLYFAFRFDRPPYATEIKAGNDPKLVWADDCFEFFVAPEPGSGWEYCFVGNVLGVKEEGRRTNVTDKAWDAQWQYQARKTDRGWEGEMAIPFASMKRSTPAVGEIWSINPARNNKTPQADVAVWSYFKDWNADEDMGYLVFGGPSPVAKIVQAGDISRSEVGMMLELSNFTDKDATIEVAMSIQQANDPNLEYFKAVDLTANPLGPQTSAEAKDWVESPKVAADMARKYKALAQKTETIKLPVGQTRRVPVTFETTRGGYVLHYMAKHVEANSILAAGPLPVFRRAPLELVVTPYMLTAGVLEVVSDFRKVGGVQEGDTVTVQLVDGKKALIQQSAKVDMKAQRNVLALPMKDVKPGNYKILCRIAPAAGEARAEREEDFEVIPTPKWFGNDYGKPEKNDMVPEPWPAMEKKDSGFTVWNRAVELGDNLQPTQITAAKAPMFAGPAKLELAAPGLTLGKAKRTEAKKTRISYEQSVKAENLTGELRLDAEFDGFMKYTLALEPKGTAKLDKLVLEIPLKGDIVTHFHHGFLYTSSAGKRKPAERNYTYGAVGADGLSLPFTHELWVGNEYQGFEWVAQNDRWWSPADPEKVVTLQRQGDSAVIRIEIVGKTAELSQPVKYQWAILPTPTKPMNHDYLHGLRLSQSGFGLDPTKTKLDPSTDRYLDALVKGGANAYCQWSWSNSPTAVWNQDFGSPGYRPSELNTIRAKAFREAVKLSHEKGIKQVIAYGIWNCFPDWPDVGYYWKEQALQPLRPMEGAYLYSVTPAFNDWYVATLRKTIQDTDIDGLYMDSSPDPHFDINPYAGYGWTDASGVQHGSYPVFDCRELHKRVYTLFHGEMKRGGLLYVHNSHYPLMAVESFVDVHHCGEGSTLKTEWIIPKFYGYPFGVPVSFTRWNNPVYPETRMNSWRFVLQVDSTIKSHPSMIISKKDFPEVKGGGRENTMITNGYNKKAEAVYQVWQAYIKYPWQGSQWVPNWRVQPYVKTGDEALWACLHTNPGKAAMIVVSSFKEQPSKIDLQVDWGKLGFSPDNVKIADCITGVTVAPTSTGVAGLEVDGNLWRMLYVEPAK